MPSFCNVLFFSTSKKLRREFLTNTDEETKKKFSCFCARPKFHNHYFLLSPSIIIKARRAWTATFGFWHDKNLTLVCHTSMVSLIFLHKNLSDWPILLLLVDFFLSVCLSVCCAQIYDSNESDRKRLNRRLSFTSSCRNC